MWNSGNSYVSSPILKFMKVSISTSLYCYVSGKRKPSHVTKGGPNKIYNQVQKYTKWDFNPLPQSQGGAFFTTTPPV